MKIVQQSAKLLAHTPNPECLIERCGRIAYKSENKINVGTAQKFIEMIIKNGHESVLEHASATILFICDRGVSHEIVRHRICSFTQESTRYCRYSDKKHDGITVIKPPFNGNDSDFLEDCWRLLCHDSELCYINMINNGVAPEIARSVLPTCLKTEIAVTCNFREWRHFLKLRMAPSAHPQIREIAQMAFVELKKIAPTVFGDI
jgi:thymidylate synthase (FAD)